MISQHQRRIVYERSGAKCEAMILIPGRSVWTRCWMGPVELHHMLTRGRGGGILDSAGETYHLIALCPDCHRRSDGGEAYAGELLIDGYVTTDNVGLPVYNGSDPYLSEKYKEKK
jgi:hypothetical protein